MPHIFQSLDQETFIDPYSSTLFDMGVQDSRVYLSRQVNSILRAFGEDIVISGLETVAVLNNNIIAVSIRPGRCIIDTTLHIFKTIVNLDLDLSPYDPSGYVVLSVSYKYIQTMQNNRPYFKLSYVSADGQVQLPDAWSTSRDRVVLDVYKFTKDPITGNITSITNINTHIQIVDYIYIPRITFFPVSQINDPGNSYFNDSLVQSRPLNGGTFFDDDSNYRIIDFGVF